MIFWDACCAQWFADAAEFTGYAEKMAALLRRELRQTETVCDIGCGVGTVSLALAPSVGTMTCIDADALPLRFLAQQAKEKGISNLRVLQQEAQTVEGRWQSVISLFFGDLRRDGEKLLSLASDRFLLVTHAKNGVFGPEGQRPRKNFTAAQAREWLEAHGYSYHAHEDALEYGQPLRNREDAEAFAASVMPHLSERERLAHLENALVETGNARFPLYLPGKKHFELITIDLA